MNFPGPISVAPIDPALRHEMVLRPFQRITAEVMQVTATHAILSVDGFPVVAQLTSPDQAAALRDQRLAQFVVSQTDGQTIVLKFLRPGSAEAGPVAETVRSDLATRLLTQMGQPVTSENLVLARAALNQRLVVTQDLFKELSTALSVLPNWGTAEAEIAAAIKAAGLPLTPGSILLAVRNGEQVGESMAHLTALLTQAAQEPGLPEPLRQVLQQGLLLLDDAAIDWNQPPGQMADKIKTAVEFLGRSFEHILKEQVQGSSPFWPEKTLVQMARLQDSFLEAGRPELANAVSRFIDDTRQTQLMNVHSEQIPGKGSWTEMGLMLRVPDKGPDPDYYPARLRVAHRSGPQSGKIDPAFTRLVIQVDLEAGQTIQVDLTMVGKQIHAAVTTPNPELCTRAQEEIPALEDDLHKLGYDLNDTQVGVGMPPPFDNLETHRDSGDVLMTVDLEV